MHISPQSPSNANAPPDAKLPPALIESTAFEVLHDKDLGHLLISLEVSKNSGNGNCTMNVRELYAYELAIEASSTFSKKYNILSIGGRVEMSGSYRGGVLRVKRLGSRHITRKMEQGGGVRDERAEGEDRGRTCCGRLLHFKFVGFVLNVTCTEICYYSRFNSNQTNLFLLIMTADIKPTFSEIRDT